MNLKAPFPWFGGKSAVAAEVWARFGDVPNFIEPFFGSGAVLLNRPTPPGIETVNDLDGLLCNAWRAIQYAPQATAEAADWPVSECDLHARHLWLVVAKDSITERLMGDPGWCDPKAAGWWLWGMACWIGSEFCSGKGPWQSVDGKITKSDSGLGVNRQLPHLGDAGRGVNRQLPHLGDAGRGVNRTSMAGGLQDYFAALSDRLRRVRVCCGDWGRVVTPVVHNCATPCGIFLDPPYTAQAGRDNELYTHDSGDVGHAVAAWALANGDNRDLRIAVCGYEEEYEFPASWECFAWKTSGGYAKTDNGNGTANCHRERIWFSPHCLRDTQTPLFAGLADGPADGLDTTYVGNGRKSNKKKKIAGSDVKA